MILILGIIALIAIPTVNSVIKQSNKGAFESGVRNVLKTVENQCAMDMLNGNSETKYYDFSEDGVTLGLDLKGKIPTSGTIIVDSDCKTMVSVSDGNYTASKLVTEEEISFKEGNDAINYLQIPRKEETIKYVIYRGDEGFNQAQYDAIKTVTTDSVALDFFKGIDGYGDGFFLKENDEVLTYTSLMFVKNKDNYTRDDYNNFLTTLNELAKKDIASVVSDENAIKAIIKQNKYYIVDKYVIFSVIDMGLLVENNFLTYENMGIQNFDELFEIYKTNYGNPTFNIDFK